MIRKYYLTNYAYFMPYIILFMLLGSKVLFGQELRLFEETESMQRQSDSPVAVETRRDRDGNLITGPEFTLIGTSRIGSKLLAVIENRVGETISVSLPEGLPKSVPGYPNYRVIEVSSGQASIEYPANLPCVEFLDQGVACESQNLAVLSLKNSEPLEPSNPRMSSDNLGGISGSVDADETVNPFEAILERAANPDTEIESDGGFTPRRIDPEDIPAGMRVVSTPFGDRLVEIDQ